MSKAKYVVLSLLLFIFSGEVYAGDVGKSEDVRIQSKAFKERLGDLYAASAKQAHEDSSYDLEDYYRNRIRDLHNNKLQITKAEGFKFRDDAYKHELLRAEQTLRELSSHEKVGDSESITGMIADAYHCYECWLLNQQAESYLARALRCRRQFETAVVDVYKKIKEKAPIWLHDSVKLHKTIGIDSASHVYHVNIFFALNSSELSKESWRTVLDASHHIKDFNRKYYKVVISGHADKSGPGDFNAKLAKERAERVGEALVKLGVSSDLLSYEPLGDDVPVVYTDRAEHTNRRAGIYIVGR